MTAHDSKSIIASSNKCRLTHKALYKWLCDTGNIKLASRVAQGSYTNKVSVKYSNLEHSTKEDPDNIPKCLVNLTSFNYTGLMSRPEVINAAKDAIDLFGVSAGGARLLNGTNQLHVEFEERLAKFLGVEAALTYSSCYVANISLISSLCSSDDVIFSDCFNHQSIKDGILFSGAKYVEFEHKNYAQLEHFLNSIPILQRKFVITDGIFSMEGDIADLDVIVDLSEKYNFFIIVDGAHATGVLGQNGRGTSHMFGLEKK